MIGDVATERVEYKWKGQRHVCTNVMWVRDGVNVSARFEGEWTLRQAVDYLKARELQPGATKVLTKDHAPDTR